MNKQTPGAPPPDGTGVVNRLGRRPARIPSRVVLGGDDEVVIVHGNEEYLLRVTHEGKLVLTR